MPDPSPTSFVAGCSSPWWPAFLMVLLAVLHAVPIAAAGASDAAASLDRLLERAFAEQLELDPSFAAQIGDPRHRDRLTIPWTEAHRQARRAWIRRHGEALDAIDRNRLDPRRQVFYDAFRWQLDTTAEALAHPGHLLPLMPGFGTPSTLAETAAGHLDLDLSNVADAEAFLGRAEDFSPWVDATIAALEDGRRRGIVHPKAVVYEAMRDLRDHTRRRSSGVFQRAVAAVPRHETELIGRLHETIETQVLPAYGRLHDYLRNDYLRAARESLGMADLPGGDAWYRERIRTFTSTDLDPEEIFAMGEREVKRVKKALRKVRWGQSLRRRTSSRREVLDRFRQIEAKIRPALPRLFSRLPTTPLEVRDVSAERSVVPAGAFYERPKHDGSPGIFYFGMRGGFDLSTAEVLYLHEALPGHHLQIALARESRDLPEFLRHGYVGGYIEGWGLYSESLGDELGLYTKADQKIGRLRYALGRAGRLIADVGLHHRGWSRGRAEAELNRRGLDWAVRELDRYAMIPGQGLCYTVGELRFREWRRRAESALGSAFDLRGFHDLVLGYGPLPLDVLEREVDRWIAEQRANS
ncbi:MAG: DUF885 domain-containing protein [Acidobacteriota bacterium]